MESNLHSHAQFQDGMNRLTDWVVVTHQTIETRGLSPGQAQVGNLLENTSRVRHNIANVILLFLFKALEASMKDRKRDLEDLLALSIELQRRQQLLPQEKVLICFDTLIVQMEHTVFLL